MQRIRIVVRYDGTDFAGSQIQPGKRTVAGTLKAGLESLLGQEVKLDFASRTDAGVHAEGNVCAFAAKLPFSSAKLPMLLRSWLPEDLIVIDAATAGVDFHPRFDAVSRTYVYRVWIGKHPPVRMMRYVGELPAAWELAKVTATLPLLRGEHDFSAFSASGLEPQDSYCKIRRASMRARGEELEFTFTANRFLRHMVVRLVGALAKVGSGQLEPEAIRDVLATGKGFQFKPAPAKGLTLVSVQYRPEHRH